MEDINSKEFLDRVTSVVPTQLQIDFQNIGYYNFIHFGLNTFTKKEWGSGHVDPSVFTLKEINTDKWVEALKSTGSKGIIITAKHHDGFCLFQTKYTDYSIAATNYRGGKGDVVKDLADSCKKYGMKLGIYLSPWDRHEKTYGSDAYNDYFCNQLEELCTNYGEIFCFWFDGACGEGPNGKKQVYDWDRYYSLIRRLQPSCALANCGPDVRWIGNEAGKGRKSEWSVVSLGQKNNDKIAENSQQEAGANVMSKAPDYTDDCIGSREQIAGRALGWYPAEMDVPVTYKGWFWRPLWEYCFLRSKENLLDCYYNSVGNNGTLLLNVPPNKYGNMPKRYINRLLQAKKEIEKRFQNKAEILSQKQEGNTFILKIKPQKVYTIVLAEDVTKSQRVEKFHIELDGKKVYENTCIGFKKICLLDEPYDNISEVKIVIDECRNEPYFHNIKIY